MTLDCISKPIVREVAVLVLDGYETYEIAGKLGISSKSVKAHLRSLYELAGIRRGSKRVRLIQTLDTTSEKLLLPEMPSRPKQIAKLVIEGFTNIEIANQLSISEQMVKNYLRVIFDACGAWTRTELAARFRCA